MRGNVFNTTQSKFKINIDSRHIWGYLRVVLSNLNRLDLVELSGRENLDDMSAAVASL